MRHYLLVCLTLTVALGVAHATTQEAARLPDWSGQWIRTGSGSFDPSKPAGLRQGAPLTPEYQAILEATTQLKAIAKAPLKARRVKPGKAGRTP